MRKRSMRDAWRLALGIVALVATLMALYVQVFERRSRREEDRLAAARLEEALADSRARLKAEILAELRAELADGGVSNQAGRPLPNAVLRRSEAGGGRTLQQVLSSADAQEAVLTRFQESLDALARTDRTVRQDLEELRAEVRRDQDVSGKVLSLLLIALVPLVVHLLASLWPRADSEGPPPDGNGP
jgi:hypothetical protein